ncbi:MAG: hypothetical protein MJ252_16185 [archaeon]|nr:hypothetical protein [archaeon]
MIDFKNSSYFSNPNQITFEYRSLPNEKVTSMPVQRIYSNQKSNDQYNPINNQNNNLNHPMNSTQNQIQNYNLNENNFMREMQKEGRPISQIRNNDAFNNNQNDAPITERMSREDIINKYGKKYGINSKYDNNENRSFNKENKEDKGNIKEYKSKESFGRNTDLNNAEKINNSYYGQNFNDAKMNPNINEPQNKKNNFGATNNVIDIKSSQNVFNQNLDDDYNSNMKHKLSSNINNNQNQNTNLNTIRTGYSNNSTDQKYGNNSIIQRTVERTIENKESPAFANNQMNFNRFKEETFGNKDMEENKNNSERNNKNYYMEGRNLERPKDDLNLKYNYDNPSNRNKIQNERIYENSKSNGENIQRPINEENDLKERAESPYMNHEYDPEKIIAKYNLCNPEEEDELIRNLMKMNDRNPNSFNNQNKNKSIQNYKPIDKNQFENNPQNNPENIENEDINEENLPDIEYQRDIENLNKFNIPLSELSKLPEKEQIKILYANNQNLIKAYKDLRADYRDLQKENNLLRAALGGSEEGKKNFRNMMMNENKELKQRNKNLENVVNPLIDYVNEINSVTEGEQIDSNKIINMCKDNKGDEPRSLLTSQEQVNHFRDYLNKKKKVTFDLLTQMKDDSKRNKKGKRKNSQNSRYSGNSYYYYEGNDNESMDQLEENLLSGGRPKRKQNKNNTEKDYSNLIQEGLDSTLNRNKSNRSIKNKNEHGEGFNRFMALMGKEVEKIINTKNPTDGYFTKMSKEKIRRSESNYSGYKNNPNNISSSHHHSSYRDSSERRRRKASRDSNRDTNKDYSEFNESNYDYYKNRDTNCEACKLGISNSMKGYSPLTCSPHRNRYVNNNNKEE